MAIKFVSINIELSRHLERVRDFLQKEKPDFVCIQELMEVDIPFFTNEFGYNHYFSAMSRKQLNDASWNGIGIFSPYPLINPQTFQYGGIQEIPGVFDMTTVLTKRKSQRYLLQTCQIEKANKLYTIGNTHFTWTPNGQADEYQREDLNNLLNFLKQHEPLIFAGDFNAPRGREIFSKISEAYRDNIPAHYQTSLDENLHRCGYLPYVVDGLFSSPEYKVSDVELVFGVSDHAAVKAVVDIA